MSIEALRTDLTFEGDRIVQLDIHIPEILPEEVMVGIDLKIFCQRYPLRGGVAINQEVEGKNEGYTVERFSRKTDTLNIDDDLEVADLALRDDSLRVNQYIGKIGTNGIAIGVSTYDIKQATKDARKWHNRKRDVLKVLDDYYTPN